MASSRTFAIDTQVTSDNSRRPITRPEAVATALCTTLAAIIVVGYVWARFGRLAPAGMLIVAAVSGVVTFAILLRNARGNIDREAALAAAIAFAAVSALLVYFGWPTLLLPGGGPDLSHHLMLIDFLERNWRLPGSNMVDIMVEMAHYTPGVHMVAALVGAWSGSDGFRAAYPVVAFTVALKSVVLVLIASRILPESRGRVPLALAALVLCAVPTRYFFGSFVEDSFLAQVAAELFAVAMWWAVVLWDRRPSSLSAALFAVMGVGAFLTWPMWIGPPMVTFTAIALTRDGPTLGSRISHLLLAFVPIGLTAALHTAGRLGWLAIAGTTGVVLKPSLTVLGWPFLIGAVIGLLAAPLRQQNRVTLIFTLSIAAQAMTLYVVAEARGAAIPYMAFKMAHLIIYPLGVLAAVAVGSILARPALRAGALTIAVAVLVAITGALAHTLSRTPRAAPVVSEQFYQAGRWARSHVDAACVDYLVPNHETMHWLHLAVLGNPRSSLRTADPATFDPQKAIVRWIEPVGLPYAIAHLPTLPNDVLNNVDVLEQFGEAAVVTRRGPSSCADAQRLAGDEFRRP